MNIEYLKYFLDVARTRSITQAAKLNFISPQGMSRAMGELEKELNCNLLVRYPNKLVLSDQGEKMVPIAKRVVDEYSKLAAQALTFDVEDDGETSCQLLCQRLSSLSFIPPNAMEYIINQESGIIYREMENANIFAMLQTAFAAEADNSEDATPPINSVGIVSIFDTKRSTSFDGIHHAEELGLQYVPYLKTRDMALVSSASPLAQKKSLSREDILSRPIVSTSSALFDTIAERFGEKHIALTTSEFEFRRKFVQNDLAISFVPAIAKIIMPDDGLTTMVDFDETYGVEIGFIGTKKSLESVAFTGFVKCLDEFYRPLEHEGLFELSH